MPKESLLIFLANAILVIHAMFVLFVIGGLAAIYLGYFLQWPWVRNRYFRIIHLIAIGIVVVQSWLGMICPLTSWEMALRTKAGTEIYFGSFIQYWLQRALYYEAPEWVFVLSYTVFGCLVLISWYIVPTDHKPRKSNTL